jgi:large subunit ribosomal protein L19e
MNLGGKKGLASRTLGVGKDRIIFIKTEEVKEAITKQDIRDMLSSGAIILRENRGRRRQEKKRFRGMGNVKKKLNTRKEDYVKLTRKLREYAKQLLLQEKINKEQFRKLRKEIKSKMFRSKAHFKELLEQNKK